MKISDSFRRLTGISKPAKLSEDQAATKPAINPIGLTTKMSRRQFLTTLASAGVALNIPKIASAEANNTVEQTEHAEHDEHHELHTAPEWLDMLTASGVAASFAHQVIYEGAYKGVPLGPKSASIVGGTALLRDLILYLFGGEGGKVQATHEIQHLAKDAIPVPVLVGLSDFTTTELKVDAPDIFKKVKGAMNDNIDYRNITRPSLGDASSEWKSHLDKAEQDLRTKTSQIAAITTVLGPLGTTYTSSSLANELKADIHRILFEQSYALQVLEVKKSAGESAIIHREEVVKSASSRADDLMNGNFGYTKLMFTLAANTDGSFGAGDPPELYFAMNHADDLNTILAGHSAGLVNSELFTTLLTSMWLKKAGVFSPETVKDFIVYQGTTIVSIAQSLLDSDLRSVSFGNASKQASEVVQALDDKTDPEGKLRSVLAKMPSAQFQFGGYLQSKVDYLKHSLNQARGIQDYQDVLTTLESMSGSLENVSVDDFSQVLKQFLANDKLDQSKLLAALEKAGSTVTAKKLAYLFDGVIAESLNNPVPSQESVPTESSQIDQANVDKYRNIFSSISEMVGETKKPEKIRASLEELKNSTETTHQNIARILLTADDNTIAEAITHLTRIEKSQDVIPGLQGSDHLESVAEAMHHSTPHKPSFLSHSANEVLWALCTQIPSVKALSRLASVLIPKVAGVESGQKPTPEQLKTICRTMLFIEAGMSGVADNVAAYLFAEGTLYDFFKSTFGDDILERFPKAKTVVAVIAKLVAEQAGSLTQVGNGPNFSQEKTSIVIDESNSQGISIDRSQIKMGETLPHKNAFSLTANLILIGVSDRLLLSLINEIVEFNNQAN